MESQSQNPEFRNNPENFHPCMYLQAKWKTVDIEWENCQCQPISIYTVFKTRCIWVKHGISQFSRQEGLMTNKYLFLNQNICCGFSKEPSQ